MRFKKSLPDTCSCSLISWFGDRLDVTKTKKNKVQCSVGRSVVSNSLPPHGLYSPWNSPDQKSGVGNLSLLQGLFPTQGSSLGLPHRRQILYQLSHKGSPRILKWVVYAFSSRSPRIKLGSPALQADSLPTELSGEPYCIWNVWRRPKQIFSLFSLFEWVH